MEQVEVEHLGPALATQHRGGLMHGRRPAEEKEAVMDAFRRGDVRGMGLMQGVELVKDRTTKEPAPEATVQLMERAKENGLLIGKGGLSGRMNALTSTFVSRKLRALMELVPVESPAARTPAGLPGELPEFGDVPVGVVGAEEIYPLVGRAEGIGNLIHAMYTEVHRVDDWVIYRYNGFCETNVCEVTK